MSLRRIAQVVFLAAGVAILVLLIVPAVHVPFIVIHGPATALRAQRSAALFDLLLRAVAFLFAGVLLPFLAAHEIVISVSPRVSLSALRLSYALRC